MSISKSFFTSSSLPNPPHSSETRKSIALCSSTRNHDQTRFWDSSIILKKSYRNRRRFLVRSVVQPGAQPPSGPPFNLLKWVLGIAITAIFPFFSNKWTSLLRIKNSVETAVEIAEEIVQAVEKVAEGVEKAAEKIAEDLPEGGGLRKAVDFVEHVAEIANKEAHIVGDLIDKVQEVEEKVEDYVESLVEGATNHKQDHEITGTGKEEERVLQEPLKEEENINDETHKY